MRRCGLRRLPACPLKNSNVFCGESDISHTRVKSCHDAVSLDCDAVDEERAVVVVTVSCKGLKREGLLPKF